jgi:hypothetical protein
MGMFVRSSQTVGPNGPHFPSFDTVAVTPSDTVDFPKGSGINRNASGIMAGTAGNIAVNLIGGGTAVLTGMSAGQVILLSCSRVLATGTTSTGVMVLF